jgi:hypothetical protein
MSMNVCATCRRNTHNHKVDYIGECLLGKVREFVLDESPSSSGDDALGNDRVIAR